MADTQDTLDECWSLDGEHFQYDSIEDLIDCNDHLGAGDEVYRGEQVYTDPAIWVDADDVIENLSCRASDVAGEYADDYPDISEEAKAELQTLLEEWARKHAQPSFYLVKKVTEYTLTEEDLE